MALVDKMAFGDALAHELTTQDRRESTTRGYNPHALGIVLGAAQDVVDAVAKGASPIDAFADAFCATRGMHSVARRLGLALDVKAGRWVKIPAKQPDCAGEARRDNDAYHGGYFAHANLGCPGHDYKPA